MNDDVNEKYASMLAASRYWLRRNNGLTEEDAIKRLMTLPIFDRWFWYSENEKELESRANFAALVLDHTTAEERKLLQERFQRLRSVVNDAVMARYGYPWFEKSQLREDAHVLEELSDFPSEIVLRVYDKYMLALR